MMNSIAAIAIGIVALLHVLFLVLEMLLWKTPFGRKIFGLSEEYANKSAALTANQPAQRFSGRLFIIGFIRNGRS